jgi:YegS/Rv2252/BmrU family lipid kinase
MRISVIFNPNAKGGRAGRVLARLDVAKDGATLVPTEAPGHARALAAAAARDGVGTIVAAGGDGTVNEILNGLGDSQAFARVRLAVLPAGTGNCFARELHMPLDAARAWKAIVAGREQLVDLPQAEFQRAGEVRHAYFAQMAGAGVDARAVVLLNPMLKHRSGYAAHIASGISAARGRHVRIMVTGSGEAVGEQVVIANGRFYGGPFVLSPNAAVDDGVLDCAVLPHAGWTAVCGCLWGAATRRLDRAAGMRHLRGTNFALAAPARVPLQLDGELAGELPCRISVEPRRLRVVVP